MSEIPFFTTRAAFAMRVSQLSSLLYQQMERCLVSRGLRLRGYTTSIVQTLHHAGPQSITELAGSLQLSHQLASQRVRWLVGEGFVTIDRGAEARRRRLVTLPPDGPAEAENLQACPPVLDPASAALVRSHRLLCCFTCVLFVEFRHIGFINISSVEGKQANKVNVSHYITFKHAINGFTKAVAFENGENGITSNAISPGAVETDLMTEVGPSAADSMGITYNEFKENYAREAAIKRLNTVEEVAGMALFLCSDLGAGITGAILPVDGGTAL